MAGSSQIFVLRQEANLYRVRLSSELLGELAWPSTEEFKCLGFFRFPGELLCAALPVTNEDGTHPFDGIIQFKNFRELKNIHSLASVPPANVLIAPHRVIEFSAAWTSSKRTQLDLQLGTEVTKRLGWNPPDPQPIYARGWSRLLLLMSAARFDDLQKEDFSKWRPPHEPIEDAPSNV